MEAEHLTISIGAATTTDVYGAELLHRLIEQADRVVYRAKALGRNRALHYSFQETLAHFSKVQQR